MTVKPIISLYLFFSIANYLFAGHQPIANKDAIVISDEVRFTVLTPHLVRMEWNEDRKFS